MSKKPQKDKDTPSTQIIWRVINYLRGIYAAARHLWNVRYGKERVTSVERWVVRILNSIFIGLFVAVFAWRFMGREAAIDHWKWGVITGLSVFVAQVVVQAIMFWWHTLYIAATRDENQRTQLAQKDRQLAEQEHTIDQQKKRIEELEQESHDKGS